MKILQVVPKSGGNSKLKKLLKNTERHLRGPHTAFHRIRGYSGTKQQADCW
jgi:hypothetical protein